MKKVIGITGGVGAGKSCVLNFLAEKYGADVIIADAIAAEQEEKGGPAYQPLIDAFGEDILDAGKNLDRKAFAARIFADPEALARVNSIVHPLTIKEIKRRIENSDASVVVVEAAIIPETLRTICDELWFVDADEKIRSERLISGRGYSPEKCADIMRNQDSRGEFLSVCDRVIENNASPEDMQKQIVSILGSPQNYTRRDAL